MNGTSAPLDRLEARLERLAARVDELERGLAARDAADERLKADACEPARRRRRRHVGHASRL